MDARHDFGKILSQNLFELGMEPFARLDVLRHDHDLGEEVVRQLHIERQVEANGALSDIGAPAADVGIALKHLVEAFR
jgi:hypothetical protein